LILFRRIIAAQSCRFTNFGERQ